MQQCSRLSDGIEKINEASLQIDQLSIIVEEQRKNVVEAAQRCEQMLGGIETCRWHHFSLESSSFVQLL